VHVSKTYGRLPLADALAPTVALAEQGWTFGDKNLAMMGWREAALAADAGAAPLLLVDGKTPAVGTRMRNPDYADVLKRLGRDGFDGFYRGEIARRLVDGVRAAGGIWTLEDLAQYRVVEREPLVFSHRGKTVVTAPPPSSGGIALAQTLQILDGYDWSRRSELDRLHLRIEAMRRAYRDRAVFLGDPDFVEVPVELLTAPAYAAGLRAGIHPEKATPSAMLPGVTAIERPDTTHFSIIDAEGNIASVTQTVNLPYGNAMVIPGTGFLLNNEMDDFSVKAGVPNAFGLVGDDANAIAPGKRPLSSMTPTIVLGDEQIAVLGTPGGSRIILYVLKSLVALIDWEMDAQAAAALVNFGSQGRGLELESTTASAYDAMTRPWALRSTLWQALRLKPFGHRIDFDMMTSGLHIVVRRGADRLEGGADPRREGVALGD
jgi:gamma-glutamyltranspeptidase/glutathione hydrolase